MLAQSLSYTTIAHRKTGMNQLQTMYVKVELFGKDGDTLYHWITDVSPYVDDILQWYRRKNRGIPGFSIRYDVERHLFRMEYTGLALKIYQQRIADPNKDALESEGYDLFMEHYFYPFQVHGFLST
jgi:hypothetical protein